MYLQTRCPICLLFIYWFFSNYSSKIILMLECLGLKECEGKPKVNYVTVFERPGLREFLKQLSEFSELVLFTAGLEGIKITLPCFLDPLLPF